MDVKLTTQYFAGTQPNPRSGEDHLCVRLHPGILVHLRDGAPRAGAVQVGDRHTQRGGQPGALPRQGCRRPGGVVSVE